ncbi:WD40/YVTN/BNR-like repeat-containing protein [Delftia lacustris]|uniref:WD40/YVTN/BNR-like repeat-containing protein n=1 Tax=Delftia lacustris TaxID=558537 RepID=UPI0006407490|nr:hypothetical protein [Delftia lacustris]
MKKRAFLATSLVLAALLLSGCATRPIEPTQTLNGTEGAVVLKLITAGTGELDPADTLSDLAIRRVLNPGEEATGQDSAVLLRRRTTTLSTAVFSGMVRPGRYTLVQLSGGRGNMSYYYPLSQRFGTFEVRQGEVTLLGTLVMHPTTGRGFVTGYVAPEADMMATVKELYPALARQTQGRPALGFDPDSRLAAQAGLMPRIKMLASTWNGLNQSADGEFLAGSKLGKVLWRKADSSRWQELEIGTLREVAFVRRWKGGLLAAGEEGLLALSDGQGQNWKMLNPPDNAFIAVAQPLPDGRIAAFVRRDRVWTAYAGSGTDTIVWQKLGSFDDSMSLNIGWKRSMAIALPDRAGIVLPNGEMHLYDGQSLHRRATGQSTLAIQGQPNGSIVARVATVATSTLISRDGGTTWSDTGLGRFALTQAFKDATTGYALTAINPGLFPGPYGLMTTRDGGKTWVHTGESPGLAGKLAVLEMAVDRRDGSLRAFLPDNAIVRSTDEGATWRIVKDLR